MRASAWYRTAEAELPMRMIFVDLPVTDLATSRAFWSALGRGFEAGPMYGASFSDPDGHVWELMALPPEGAGS